MSELQIFIAALLVSVALLNTIANRLRIPFPIVLVFGGLLLALIPGIPNVELTRTSSSSSSCRRSSTRPPSSPTSRRCAAACG